MSKKKVEVILLCGALFLLLVVVILIYCIFPKKYETAVRTCTTELGLEEELVYAIIKAESGFREDASSRAGAVGLMQIMPTTARFLRELYGVSLREEVPEENIRLGCLYLCYLSEKFDSTELILAAYNAGEGTVRSWMASGEIASDGKFSRLPFAETDRYVRKVKFFEKCYRIFY